MIGSREKQSILGGENKNKMHCVIVLRIDFGCFYLFQ